MKKIFYFLLVFSSVAYAQTAYSPRDSTTVRSLTSNPSDCGSDTYATSIDASGNLTCGAVTDAGVTNALTIDGGTINNSGIGTSNPSAGTFTSLNATGGGALTGTWSNLGTVTTVDVNGGTLDNVIIGGATSAAGTFTAIVGTSLNLSEGNMTNGGALDVDSINADNISVNYNDVNVLELTQSDLATGSCTLGQLRYDTGGSLDELCYCQATNSWLCATLTAGPAD